ncbi:MAG: PAS domain-containing sensor histidine kinase [Nitrospirae bacterium]|uniref:PAS domain-containing sensor histidine kinase n=1 Tax=Candidatus Magnetobacterium casense TaxID=1455061 RepID=UPI0005902FE9|nr:PAS domain-containing sensor histidine kinase [Candidatus Magnetobacterium casensis]MBF0336634.1 PAS domain-containing sensor histidine kinase [Nitrospirota bacterium]
MLNGEEMYREIFTHSQAIMWIYDPEILYFVEANNAACAFYGYDREEFCRKQLTDIILNPQEELNDMVRGVRQGRLRYLTNRHRTSTGEIKDVEVYPGVIKIDGKDYVCSTIHDITQRKLLEDEVRLSQEILNNVAEGVSLVRASDGVIVYTNPQLDRMFGYAQDDLAGRHVSVLNAPTDIDPMEKAREIMQSLNKNGVWCDEILNIKKDGTHFWCYATVSTFQHGGHGTVWVAVHIDITERRELEQKFLAQIKFSDAVINSLPGVFYLFDDTGKFLRWNQNIETVTGYSSNEISAMHPTDFFTGEHREAVINAITETYKNGAGNVEASLYTKDGRLIPYYFNGFMIELQGKQCLVGIGIDISERKEIERKIKDINHNLQERINEEVERNRVKDRIMLEQSRHIAMSELLMNISHHWRQPLCAIGLLIQDIKDAYLHDELDLAYIEGNVDVVMSELNALSDIIVNFQNFYVNDKEQRHFNIAKEIDKAIMLLSGYIKDKGIVIDKTLDDELMIPGFPNEFAQAILNILTNAKDVFEQRDVINGVIKLNAYKDNSTGHTIITIKDNGGGIQPNIINKVFDPYFTTKHKARGTGNGLYMAKALIEQNMNATISVRNVDDGCEFRICV